jgi:transposase
MLLFVAKFTRELPEGRERKGFRFRAYPTPEQEQVIFEIQVGCKRCWNWLVSQGKQTWEARRAYAIKEDLVGPRPERPNYDGLPPEASHEAKLKYSKRCREWNTQVKKAVDKLPQCSYRSLREWADHFGVKQDYQVFKHALVWDEETPGRLPPPNVLQALVKDYQAALRATSRGQRPPQFKKRAEDFSVRVMTGPTDEGKKSIFKMGSFGSRPSCPNGRKDWLNSVGKLPYIGWIPGRIGPDQVDRIQAAKYRLNGICLSQEADGWYFSIKQDVPKKKPLEVIPGTACGIDVGLVDMAALTDLEDVSHIVKNPRGRTYIERIAGRQAQGLPVSKMQCQAARNVREIIRAGGGTLSDGRPNRVGLFKLIDEGKYEYIFIEDLSSGVGQMGSSLVSIMRTLRTMLIDRYGDRVREVQPHHTSQECSKCGERSKDSWSFKHGRKGKCPFCGHTEHRDLNAARNVLFKGRESLGF